MNSLGECYQLWGDPSDAPALIRRCLTPRRKNSATNRALFLIGDSNAAHLVPALTRAALKDQMEFVWVARQSCSFMAEGDMTWCLNDPRLGEERIRIGLEYSREVTAALESQVQAGDIVALAGFESTHILKLTRKMLRELAARIFEPRGATLLILGSIPKLLNSDATAEVAACLHHPARCQRPYDYHVSERPFSVVHAMAAKALAAETKAIAWLDLFDLFCELPRRHVCTPFVPGTRILAYVDTMHLSRAGSLYLWPFFCEALQDITLGLSVQPAVASGSEGGGLEARLG